MRILYVTDQLYLFGGAEKILTQKLNYWADVFEYDVMVVTSSQFGKAPFFKLSNKVKHIDLGIDYPDGSLYHPRNFKRFSQHYKKLKATISDYNPDGVFVLSQRLPNIITPFAAGKIPAFYELHTSWRGFKNNYDAQPAIYRIKTRILDAITRFAENRYSKIVYLNPTELSLFNRKNGIVIPNFYDDSLPQPVETRKKSVVTLGRLSYEKRYDRLLDAWKLLDEKIEGWELFIFGDGVEREKLERQQNATVWRNPVHLPGATSEPAKKLAESSIYALSSQVETFPMALLEALSNGLPIVSFDCESGPRHIITAGEDGILVPSEDVKALSDALLELMQNDEERARMSQRAKQNVKRFNAAAIMARWDELLKNTIAAK
ncbi:MAG: glycosyltransferase family 4 protein [Flavobacterium sp.]|uniref:glycosyltransferase family 4 protein n=1 Tax=Flavobacterium sp. TaxID=239 RepID=UPI00122AC33D|nr:glycosyltransferase family 4 protein [Flavobacterium sp.]RZJ65400.1 MAG: glycosyltransferase family 4 protein [Flavobacterium sp.]